VWRPHISGAKEAFSTHFAYIEVVRFEVLMSVTVKDAVFLDVTLCWSSWNRRFGRTVTSN
jgi:hypothetical protein